MSPQTSMQISSHSSSVGFSSSSSPSTSPSLSPSSSSPSVGLSDSQPFIASSSALKKPSLHTQKPESTSHIRFAASDCFQPSNFLMFLAKQALFFSQPSTGHSESAARRSFMSSLSPSGFMHLQSQPISSGLSPSSSFGSHLSSSSGLSQSSSPC